MKNAQKYAEDAQKLGKEQIWFVHKDNEGVYLYSLASFTAKDGIRGDTTDLFEKYKRGVLGAIPEPDMLKTLLQVKNE